MRKIILVSLSVFLVIVAGAYSILWFTQASQIKKGVENAIAQINKQQPLLTYESIETSGFPRDVNVAIVKPHFKGRIDTMLKSIGAPAPLAADPAATPQNPFASLPEWNEDLLLEGRVVFSINALSDSYSYHVIGNLVNTSVIGGQTQSRTIESTGESICTLQLERGTLLKASLWDYKTLSRDPKQLLHDVRLADCYNPGSSIVDNVTHQKLASGGLFRIYVTSAPQGSNQSLRFYLKSTDTEITPEGDKLIDSYMHLISPQSEPIAASLYGKQNMEVDFTYNAPSDISAASKNPPLDIHLSKFTLTSQLFNFDAVLDITNGMNGVNRASRFNIKTAADFSETYDTMMQTGLRHFVNELYQTPPADPRMAELQQTLQKYTPDQAYAIFYPLLPHLHPLGHIVQAVDIGYLGNPDITTGDVSLTDLQMMTTPYGITGKGAAKISPATPMPASNVTLVCHNCMQMIDDIAAYAVRVQKTMSYLNPQIAGQINTSPQLTQGVKDFLNALNVRVTDTASSNDLTFSFVSDGTMGGMTLNGKRADAVMALYREYIIPAQQIQPPQVIQGQ